MRTVDIRCEINKAILPEVSSVKCLKTSCSACASRAAVVDALLAVTDGFSGDGDPAADLETLELELLVADRDHVERRLDRVGRRRSRATPASGARSGDARGGPGAPRGGQAVVRVAGRAPGELEPLTTKPLLAIENGPAGIDCKLEAELAELPMRRRLRFATGRRRWTRSSGACKDALGLIAFFTAGEKETRAWTLRDGADGARRGRDDPLGHRARVHPLRGDPLGRPARRGVACRGAEAGVSGSRGRPTSCRTATFSTSASTYDA